MKNKNLFLVAIFLLSFILNGLTVYANNYRSEASLALKQLDTSKYFIAFKLPVAPHTKKQFQQIIATLNNCAQKNGTKLHGKARLHGTCTSRWEN